eukprot:m.58356 g.58356  ORF g.58356 m.58356 type:complete len:200 (+) comp15644_c0_seq1:257-856(+)
MEVSQSTTTGLQQLANSTLVSDAHFVAIVTAAFDNILSSAPTGAGANTLLESKSLQNADKSVVKAAYGAVVTAVLEAAKENVDADNFNGFLEENGLGTSQAKIIVDKYRANQSNLRVLLRRTGSGLPHIVDVDWKLEYFMKSNQLEKVNEPVFTLQLATENNGGQTDTVQLACSLAQMQDLVSKLKDVSKRLELLKDNA